MCVCFYTLGIGVQGKARGVRRGERPLETPDAHIPGRMKEGFHVTHTRH